MGGVAPAVLVIFVVSSRDEGGVSER